MENKNSMNMVLAVVICLAVAGVLIFISINNKTSMTTSNDIGAGNTNMPPTDTNGTPDNTARTGQVAKAGDTVAINYTGKLKNGTVFDSNVDPKFGHTDPLIFTLGAGQMIPGFDKGVIGMKVGEKKTLTIAPEDAYGAAGRPPVIPPNSTLIFDIELIGIK
jgi:hypothetical protein